MLWAPVSLLDIEINRLSQLHPPVIRINIINQQGVRHSFFQSYILLMVLIIIVILCKTEISELW